MWEIKRKDKILKKKTDLLGKSGNNGLKDEIEDNILLETSKLVVWMNMYMMHAETLELHKKERKWMDGWKKWGNNAMDWRLK